MIISRTPYRISFFGGGTDYPTWVERFGGMVLSTTINRFCYISCKILPPFFDHKYRVSYSINETVQNISEISHPAVRSCLESFWDNDNGIEIHHNGDLPARSGIGSSSTFTVGLINALRGIDGKQSDPKYLARAAISIEQDKLQENVGYQDQVAAAYGGLNRIRFLENREIIVEPLLISRNRKMELESKLMLFFTGISRNSSDIAKYQIQNIQQKETIFKKILHQVNDAIEIITNVNTDINQFGELLHMGWKLKKETSEMISNSYIDKYYELARLNGAIGGKILGAGGGGFLLLFVPEQQQDLVRECLRNLIFVPIKFEQNGSQIIYYNSD